VKLINRIFEFSKLLKICTYFCSSEKDTLNSKLNTPIKTNYLKSRFWSKNWKFVEHKIFLKKENF